MKALILFTLAIAPGIAISLYVYCKDKYDKEPRKILMISFLLGMISIFPAFIIEQTGSMLVLRGTSTLMTFVYAFVIVGCTEEGCKYFILRSYCYPKKVFDEPFDGIMYSVMVSMGFATMENLLYVYQYGIGNAFFRMFTAVPAHAAMGVIMGYYVGLAKFRKNERSLLFLGWLMAALLHGAYDFCLMEQNIPLIVTGALVSLVLGIYYARKAIRLHQDISPFRNLFTGHKEDDNGAGPVL